MLTLFDNDRSQDTMNKKQRMLALLKHWSKVDGATIPFVVAHVTVHLKYERNIQSIRKTLEMDVTVQFHQLDASNNVNGNFGQFPQ